MPIRGRLGERTLERPRHPWRRPGPHGGDGRRSHGQMLPHHALHRRPRERRLPGEHLVHHACEAIEVTPAVQLAAPGGLLRTHVRGRPHSEPGFGQPVAARGVDRSGDPEVAHHRVARLEQDILRLDVAVDHVVTVREAQGVRHLARDPHGIVHRQLPLTGQAITKRLPFDVWHHVEQEAVGFPRVMQREDVGMREPCREPDLAEKPFRPERRGQLWPQHFHGHRTVVFQVQCEENGGHPASAELALDAVAVSKRGVQSGEQVGQGGSPAGTTPS